MPALLYNFGVDVVLFGDGLGGGAQTQRFNVVRYAAEFVHEGPHGRAAGEQDLVDVVQVHIVDF
ncbi:MAG: hypothetical protein ACYSOT_00920, partial [Planctomycetota bacterium]